MSEAGFTLTPLSRIEARLVPREWDWARHNAAEVERNWQRRVAERPALFDGTVLLCHDWRLREGTCQVSFFGVRYAQFIAFRDAGSPDPGIFNAFAAIVPCTADGAVLLGEMGAHTANAGQVYFPCGTPDLGDVREDGTVALAESAARELAEETGLTLPPGAGDAPWLLLHGERQLAFLQPIRLPEPATALSERAQSHCRRQAAGHHGSELAGIVTARGPDDIDETRMPSFVRAYLRSVFRD